MLIKQKDIFCKDIIEPRIIAHVCNNIGAWGKGFVVSLSNNYSIPEQEYRKTKSRKLGDNQYA